jgi:hypothetical protein
VLTLLTLPLARGRQQEGGGVGQTNTGDVNYDILSAEKFNILLQIRMVPTMAQRGC